MTTTATTRLISPFIKTQQERPRWLRLIELVGVVGVGLAAMGLAEADNGRVDGLGLLRAPAPSYYLGVALVLVGAVRAIDTSAGRSAWFVGHVVALVFLLHGLPGLIEHNPRFPTAYLHVGFTDQIATKGALLPRLDARFSWPGFFAGAALLQRATGGDLLLWMLRFFPVVINLLTCLLIVVIGRAAGVSRGRRRAAALLFVCLNWVAQDYFAPQAIAFILDLALVASALLVFRGGGPRRRGLRAYWLRPRTVPRAALPARWQRPALIGMAFVAAAVVTSHQITPGFVSGSLLLLSLLGVTRLRAFPLAVAVAGVSWLSFAAEAYWRGHLTVLVGSAGHIHALVSQNVTTRAGGGSAERTLVVAGRFGLTGVVALGVAVSVVRLWRRRSVPLASAALVVAPVPMLLLQAYGGEMLLRVFLFALPAACLLLAELIVPPRSRMTWSKQAAFALVLVGLVPIFIVARFGNESYERVTDDDLAVVNELYNIAPRDSLVLLTDTKSPTLFARVAEVRFRVLDSTVPADVVVEARGARDYEERFLLLTEAAEQLDVQLNGAPPGWTAQLARKLLAGGSFSLVDQRGGAILLKYRSNGGRR